MARGHPPREEAKQNHSTSAALVATFCSAVIRYDTHGSSAGEQSDVKTNAVE
jgi:hypothetical protein